MSIEALLSLISRPFLYELFSALGAAAATLAAADTLRKVKTSTEAVRKIKQRRGQEVAEKEKVEFLRQLDHHELLVKSLKNSQFVDVKMFRNHYPPNKISQLVLDLDDDASMRILQRLIQSQEFERRQFVYTIASTETKRSSHKKKASSQKTVHD